MTTGVQRRRGTTVQHSTFTGLEGEITIDTTKDTAVVHDGATVGGHPLARQDLSNVNPTALSAITGSNTASGDLFIIYDVSTNSLKKITRDELNNAIEQDALANVTITGGSINGTTIGASTASTGAFTTLSASSTVSGTGFSTYLASPPAIGGTAAAAGAFTSLSASGAFSANGGTTLGDASGDALTINSSAVSIPNGLNFDSNTFVIDATNNRVGINNASPSYPLTVNGFVNVAGSVGAFKQSAEANAFAGIAVQRSSNDTSLGLGFNSSADSWQINASYASSGAYKPIAFLTSDTERMRIDSSGNVGIGTSSPTAKLNTSIAAGAVSATNVHYLLSETGTNTSTGMQIKAINSSNSWDAGAITFRRESTANSYGLIFDTSSGGTNAERMRLDSSGNLGLGVTPSAWGSGSGAWKVLETNGGAIWASGSNMSVVQNMYNNGSGYLYKANGYASFYTQTSGQHQWLNAPSGTAGNAITFTQAMTLDASGNLGIGNTSPAAKLHVSGVIRAQADGTVIRLLNAGAAGGGLIYCPATVSGGIGLSSDAGPMEFQTNSITRMTISSAGVISSSGTIKSGNGQFLDPNDNLIYLGNITNSGGYGYSQAYINTALGGGGDPAFHYVRLCRAFPGTAVNKSYFAGNIYWSRGSSTSGNISSAVQVYVSSAYLGNGVGGVNFGDAEIQIVKFTAGGVEWIGVRFSSATSYADINVIGMYASSAAPASYNDASVSSVSVLMTLGVNP